MQCRMKHDTNFFLNIFVKNFNTQKAKLQTCVMHRDKNWREWHLFLTSYDIVATQMTHTYHISRITLNDPWFIVSNWIKYNVFVLYSKNDSSLKPQVMHNHKKHSRSYCIVKKLFWAKSDYTYTVWMSTYIWIVDKMKLNHWKIPHFLRLQKFFEYDRHLIV